MLDIANAIGGQAFPPAPGTTPPTAPGA
jgi:hypothetical protein